VPRGIQALQCLLQVAWNLRQARQDVLQALRCRARVIGHQQENARADLLPRPGKLLGLQFAVKTQVAPELQRGGAQGNQPRVQALVEIG